ncbi:pleckstrin homology domain-containing family H member 1-like isoform X2 [Saccostrea echinata]|uniref:pleckstrin homology domain-containing family H member 1-like isoform X2 n=1 Tax=Saccostrea echinata TaxID=191078 RepID=UPI002A808A87|nr:pleckstrin homology domain-containing family H member 1-like isoform X2 [Saccostrea echinata]
MSKDKSEEVPTPPALDGVEWRERCLSLEASLQQFKHQVARIRETLGEKMKELEFKKREAESRAESAEQKLQLMEQQLAALQWQPKDPEHRDTKIEDLERTCQEQAHTIRSLQQQLEDQEKAHVLHRQQEAKTVEEKAGRIKEWVTAKIHQMDNQNKELLHENELLQEQVDILRERLQALPAVASKEIFRLSQQEMFPGLSSEAESSCVSPDSRPVSEFTSISHLLGSRPVSESSSRPYSRPVSEVSPVRRLSNSSWTESVKKVLRTHSLSLPPETDEQGQEVADYAESDSVSMSSSRSASMASDEPPQIPKRPSKSLMETLKMEEGSDGYNNNDTCSITPPSDDNIQEVTANISDSDDSMVDIENVPIYQEVDQNHESTYEPKKTAPPQVKIERKVFHDAHLMDSLISSSNGSEELIGHTKVKITEDILSLEVDQNGSGVEIEEEIISVTVEPDYAEVCKSKTTKVSAALPQVKQNSHMSIYKSSPNAVSAIATLPRVRSKGHTKPEILYSSGHMLNHLTQEHHPPHVLEPHIISPTRHSALQATDSKKWDRRAHTVPRKLKPSDTTDPAELTEVAKIYRELDVPVYATLKGKAAQIRSTPFTDDDSESSDNEDVTEQIDLRNSESQPSTLKVSDSKKLQQSSSGAIKRGVSCPSVSSEVSCDYADPPDETSDKSDLESLEPEKKLLRYTTDSHKQDTLEKFGYLSKLGGKVKMWKRRWFVLRNGELFYYKSQHDVLRKPQGTISLDEQTRIDNTKGETTFQISNSKKTYYFNADSLADTEKWIKILQKVLKRHATGFILDQLDTKAVSRGWLVKAKHGVTKRCWCVLLGRYFLYYKNKTDKTPSGQIHLRDARIEDVDSSEDSDDEADYDVISQYTIAIWPPFQGPTYLMLPSKHEKDSWLYHLTVAAGGGTGNVGTEYEQLIAKVMEVNGDPNSLYWKHPMMLHTKEPLSKPLTTLPSEDLQERALDLSRDINDFIYTPIDSTKLELHVELAQTILQTCLQFPELQNEFYCQMIKQLSAHPVTHKTANLLLCGKHSWYLCHTTPTSPTNSVSDLCEGRLNPITTVFLQGWQLLSLSTSLFLPKQSIMWHLKVHLQRLADPRHDMGKYAIFCQRALERTILKGNRDARPSRMEIMSILLRHPYHHSQPISIPVHLMNNTYQVISFDGSTTVDEFTQSINKTVNIRDSKYSGFYLFSDHPGNIDVEQCLQLHVKVCDVISRWEKSYQDFHSGKLDSNKTIRFIYKNRLYFKSLSTSETEKEKLLLAYQTNEEIIYGRFPLNKDLALELASLLAQVEFGDLRAPSESSQTSSSSSSPFHSNITNQLSSVLDKFYPRKYSEAEETEQRAVVMKLLERWTSLRGRTIQDCVRVYLAVVRKWPYCGAKLYMAKIKGSTTPDDVWVAVQEDGISVLEHATMQPLNTYDYRSVITFGGWKEDFMLVVSQLFESAPHHYEHRTEKLLFAMPKFKILDLTLLIASYINARVQRPSPDTSPDI